jgi:hypothetical protein
MRRKSLLSELARALVRFSHVASAIVNNAAMVMAWSDFVTVHRQHLAGLSKLVRVQSAPREKIFFSLSHRDPT